jgi:hypothetical protein
MEALNRRKELEINKTDMEWLNKEPLLEYNKGKKRADR